MCINEENKEFRKMRCRNAKVGLMVDVRKEGGVQWKVGRLGWC